MRNCSRVLNDTFHADRFLRNTLQIESDNINDYAKKIASAEMQQEQIINKDTLTFKEYRTHDYASEEARKELRKQIYNELISFTRINDDDIKLGSGGALPKTEIKSNRQAYYLIGLPASGKSGIANSLSDKYGAIIIDSDFAKRKFPEYHNSDFGASVVHEESSIVVFGGKDKYATEPSVLQYAINKGHNIVIPKIGDVSSKVLNFSKQLKKLNYDVHLILVRLDREKATKRALTRYIETKRYVPLSLIFDEYGNNPTITFYDMTRIQKVFKSYTMVSSDVPFGEKKKIIFSTKYSPTFDL